MTVMEIVDKAESEGSSAESTEPESNGKSADMNCTYGKNNRLHTWNGETVVYDENGNMTYGPVDGAMAELSYDAYHRLIKVTTADGESTLYTYDAEDVRIRAKHTRADGSTWEETYGLGLSSVTCRNKC